MRVFQRRLRQLAHEQYCRDRPRIALVLLQVAAIIGGGDSWLYDFIGLLRRDLGRSQKAIPAFRKALTLDPSNDRARRRLAHLAAIDGEADEALELLRALTAKNAASTSLIHGVVSHLTSRGLPREEALGWYRLALKHDPANKWARLSEAHCLRAIGDFDEALAIYRELGVDQEDQEISVLGRIGEVATLAFKKCHEAVHEVAEQLAKSTGSEDVREELRSEVRELHEWLAARATAVDDGLSTDGRDLEDAPTLRW